jgi:hypothetical protein
MEELRAAGKVGADGIIADNAFRNDASVTRMVGIADGDWKVGGAFSGCRNLVEVVLPESCTSLGRSAFYRCSSLATITLPASLTTLGDYAFNGCTGLATITLPASLTTLGANAHPHTATIRTITSTSRLHLVHLVHLAHWLPQRPLPLCLGADHNIAQLGGTFAPFTTMASVPAPHRVAPNGTPLAWDILYLWWAPTWPNNRVSSPVGVQWSERC